MILVPVDGSAAASHALDYACDFGKLLGAQIHVCHVADYVSLPKALANAPKTAPDLLAEEGEAILAQARRIAHKHGVAIHCRLLRGHVADEILRLAHESRADLLIMGTHGRTGIKRLVLGSVAETVTRRSDVPILLLKDPTYDFDSHATDEV
jgi:nucleotide-binding universal stress UspA family protein